MERRGRWRSPFEDPLDAPWFVRAVGARLIAKDRRSPSFDEPIAFM